MDYVREKPMSTAEEITTGLRINYETVVSLLNTLKSKGKVKATNSWPARYAVLPKKIQKNGDGYGFMDYVEEFNRKYDELKAENNRLRNELDECRRKLVTLAQRLRESLIFMNVSWPSVVSVPA